MSNREGKTGRRIKRADTQTHRETEPRRKALGRRILRSMEAYHEQGQKDIA